jgi:hypothetical protein
MGETKDINGVTFNVQWVDTPSVIKQNINTISNAVNQLPSTGGIITNDGALTGGNIGNSLISGVSVNTDPWNQPYTVTPTVTTPAIPTSGYQSFGYPQVVGNGVSTETPRIDLLEKIAAKQLDLIDQMIVVQSKQTEAMERMLKEIFDLRMELSGINKKALLDDDDCVREGW